MTGHAVVQALLKSAEWSKITTLSRSQQGTTGDTRITHSTLDLQSSAGEMASALSSVRGEYVFFCAYLARDDEQDATDVNGAMLRNFLHALRQTGAIKDLKRFVLVNGLKQYGVHLGRAKQPMHESDPWIEGPAWPPNFYYAQQRIVADAANEKQDDETAAKWEWVVTYPQDVIGVARANFMNLATALGLYASISATLPERELVFPGSLTNYVAFNCWTSARLHAEFCIWAYLEPKAGNQAFNVTNGDTESWQNIWPQLAERYGAKVPATMFPGADLSGEKNQQQYKDFEAAHLVLPTPPPIVEHADKIGLKGLFDGEDKHSVVHQQIDTTKWAQRPEVVKKWEELRDKFGLDQSTWDQATWGFLSFLFGRDFDCVVSMSKARKLGWTGYVDTKDAFFETFDQLEEQGILPKASELRK